MKGSIAIQSPTSCGLLRNLLQSLHPRPLGYDGVQIKASLFQIRLPFIKVAILLLRVQFHVHLLVYQVSVGLFLPPSVNMPPTLIQSQGFLKASQASECCSFLQEGLIRSHHTHIDFVKINSLETNKKPSFWDQ